MNKGIKGAAVVEFAIILPLLVILVFAITELGRALYQQNILAKSTAAATRYLARSYGITEYDVDTEACTMGTDFSAKLVQAQHLFVYGTVDVSNTSQAAQLENIQPTHYSAVVVARSFTVDTGSGTEDKHACVISANASVPFKGVFGDSVVPLMQMGQITLHSEAEERYIGE